MKKIILRIAIIIGIIIGILSILTLLYFLKFNNEIKKMTPLPTQLIIDNIYSVKTDFVNIFVIKNNDNYIVIDTGKDLNIASKELKKLNIDPQKVTDIFLTHNHFDHIAGIKLFNNAKIHISKIERQNNYDLLENNQLIEINDLKIKCILTPGHTKGSMSFLINEKYLFVGDTMSLKNGNVQLFNKFFNSDSNLQKITIKQLGLIPDINYIFTAHYGYSNDAKKCFENW